MSFRFGVIGQPIGHSKSPAIFRNLFRANNFKGSYHWISVQTGYPLSKVLRNLKLNGVNITSPFKETYFNQVDTLTAMAQTLGCVNVVKRVGQRLIGHNTDPEGVIHMLQQHEQILKTSHALVLGAGGAARSAIAALKSRGYSVVVMNRTVERAKALSRMLDVSYAQWGNARSIAPGGVVVSCLPPGAEIPQIDYASASLVMDATYAHSPIREHCEQNRIAYIDGVQWLVGQALGSFTFLTGKSNQLAISRFLDESENIAPRLYALSHLPESLSANDPFGMLICAGENVVTEINLLQNEAYLQGLSARYNQCTIKQK